MNESDDATKSLMNDLSHEKRREDKTKEQLAKERKEAVDRLHAKHNNTKSEPEAKVEEKDHHQKDKNSSEAAKSELSLEEKKHEKSGSHAQVSAKASQPQPDIPSSDDSKEKDQGEKDEKNSRGGIVFTSSPESDEMQVNLDSAIKDVLSTQKGAKKGNARLTTEDGHSI